MDNLKVFKTMGRFITAQINAINLGQAALAHPSRAAMGLESRLIIDAWNIQADINSGTTAAAC